MLFVGRLVEAKGVRDAVAAWRRSGVGLPLVLAGTGPLRAELAAQAGRGEGPELEVLGWVERDRLSGLYRRARALLLPSRWQEPFGIVGLEALSFGVPVVAWESGGVGEWHPGPGLVRWGDVEALARALADAVNRRVTLPPRFERDEAIGRLLAIYARVAPSTEHAAGARSQRDCDGAGRLAAARGGRSAASRDGTAGGDAAARQATGCAERIAAVHSGGVTPGARGVLGGATQHPPDETSSSSALPSWWPRSTSCRPSPSPCR